MVFPVVMYGCESWTVKKAEPRRIDALELSRHPKIIYNEPRSKVLKLAKNLDRLVKAMVFPVVIYGCESWTVKKAER